MGYGRCGTVVSYHSFKAVQSWPRLRRYYSILVGFFYYCNSVVNLTLFQYAIEAIENVRTIQLLTGETEVYQTFNTMSQKQQKSEMFIAPLNVRYSNFLSLLQF